MKQGKDSLFRSPALTIIKRRGRVCDSRTKPWIIQLVLFCFRVNNEPNLPDDDIAEEGETYANSAAENTTAGASMRSQLAEPQEAVPPAEELVDTGQYLIDYPSWLAFLG